ncbi:TPA: hypothetical protein N0F65_001746 [Lagenidium giganteum]|uniref:Uncharacterized protein n=1 Tax=Lagenidium giganteum TaxID=4803 RepID=A0AAV2Z2B4_9STRA|nr:TPA: hypothetical protein N0F65_001746 [Lagenidium giganteum]
MSTIFKVSDAAMNLYGWLDWIVNENRELALCEKPRARKYSPLPPVCRPTLKSACGACMSAFKTRLLRSCVGSVSDLNSTRGRMAVRTILQFLQ